MGAIRRVPKNSLTFLSFSKDYTAKTSDLRSLKD